MKPLLIAILIALASCYSQRFMATSQVQARLVHVERLDHGRGKLKLVKRSGDTAYFLYGRPSMTKPRFEIGAWYTIRFDSTQYRPCDSSQKCIRAELRKNK